MEIKWKKPIYRDLVIFFSGVFVGDMIALILVYLDWINII